MQGIFAFSRCFLLAPQATRAFHATPNLVIMVLCSLCKSLPPLTEFTGQPAPHHTLHSLQLSAEDGCDCCRLIWYSLSLMNCVQSLLEGIAGGAPRGAGGARH